MRDYSGNTVFVVSQTLEVICFAKLFWRFSDFWKTVVDTLNSKVCQNMNECVLIIIIYYKVTMKSSLDEFVKPIYFTNFVI